MKEEVQFIDAESFSNNNEALTFRDIVLQHIKKIGSLASVEWKGGYWETRSKVAGGSIITDKYYVPDTREEYSNAVDYLADLLFSHFDEEMLEAEKETDKQLEKAHKENDTAKGFNRQDYRFAKVKIKRCLFRALSSFLKRKDYFNAQVIED